MEHLSENLVRTKAAALIADTIIAYSDKFSLEADKWKFLIHAQPKLKLSRKFKSRFTFIFDLDANKICLETSLNALQKMGMHPEGTLTNHGGGYLIIFYQEDIQLRKTNPRPFNFSKSPG